ncbi:MAG TPA: SDR family oxidoreductase [Mycobacteriales bacterium]|nr:SDR family oxidoreductase [Mycobacteriales bacterium]
MVALTDSVAVVTGASSGIGAETARALARGGATVALVARRRERLDELAGQITAAGGRAIALPADVTDAGQAAEVVNRAERELGRLDVLVNAAGVGINGPVQEARIEDWRTMVEVNLMGVLHCTHAALPHLIRSAAGPRGVADIVTIGSVAGRFVHSENAVYAATKHAVRGFTESLRKAMTATHVRASIVAPGMVHTEMTNDSPGSIEWLEAEDVAAAVVYVCTQNRRASVSELIIRPSEQER